MQGENAMTVIAILEHGRGHSQWAVQIQCGGVGIASMGWHSFGLPQEKL